MPPVLVLQGYIKGIDFARSLVGSVPTSQVDSYLDRADALPEKLANAQVRACVTALALWYVYFKKQQHLMMSWHLCQDLLRRIMSSEKNARQRSWANAYFGLAGLALTPAAHAGQGHRRPCLVYLSALQRID